MPDRCGLDAMSLLLQGKEFSSSPPEMICPMRGDFLDCPELPRDIFKDPRRNSNFEHHLMQTKSSADCWRNSDQDVASLSKLYGPPASPHVEAKTVTLNGGNYENGLFSSSMSDIFNKKLRFPSDDAFVGQSVSTTQSNFAEDEAFESLEEIEAQTIGDLLPDDDDDLLSEAILGHGHVAQPNWADVEDDLFCSVGGLELESDDKFLCKKTSEIDCSGAFDGQERGLAKTPATEIPHSTRTLFVKNVDMNIKDMELRVLFEQFGDIETFYTSCRHHGIIMVSYYDIRAAQNAIRVLNMKSIGGQKLDIRFCITKEYPSEKDIGECVLLVTNLESSISNEDLLHIFGVHGEIQEIYEFPHKGHHKFIRFYDVRAAEAALLALNRHVIAGKRIKVELCGLRDLSFSSSTQQLSLDPGEEESSSFRKECYSKKLLSEYFVPSGLIAPVADTSTGLRNGAIQGMHTVFKIQSSSSLESNFHGISSNVPGNVAPASVAMAGNCSNQSSNCDLRHSLGQRNLGFQSMLSLPDFCDVAISDIHFKSSSTISSSVNISPTLANGVGNKNFLRIGAGGFSSRSFGENESEFNISGTGSCPPHGHKYIWNNSKTRHHRYPSSVTWENLPPFMNNIPAQTPHVYRLPRGPSQMPNHVQSQNKHVSSASAVEPLLLDGHHTFTDDAITFHPSFLDNMGYSNCSPLHSLELASHNIFTSAHVGVPSPQQRGHMVRGRNNVNIMPNLHDASNNRIRSRRCDQSASQADNRKQYELDIDRIIRGADLRTTLMIKNIPNKYTSKMLLATIDEQHKGTYDFIYLPIDFKNKCNVGYAFINMTDPQHIIPLYQVFNGKKWEKFNSEKVAYLAYARIQGKAALIAHFQNSSLMNEDKWCRPILFHSDGPNAGDQEPFPIPVGVNVRSRPSKANSQNHQGSVSGLSSEEYSSNAITGSPSRSTKNLE